MLVLNDNLIMTMLMDENAMDEEGGLIGGDYDHGCVRKMMCHMDEDA